MRSPLHYKPPDSIFQTQNKVLWIIAKSFPKQIKSPCILGIFLISNPKYNSFIRTDT